MDPILENERKIVCEQHGSPYIPLDHSLKVGIALSTLHKKPLQGIRHKQEKGTTGWYIWGGEYSDAPDFYQPLCAEHLPKHCPSILKYLSLAPGYGFVIDGEGYVDIWFDQKYLGNEA
jgi:hypothetical protein